MKKLCVTSFFKINSSKFKCLSEPSSKWHKAEVDSFLRRNDGQTCDNEHGSERQRPPLPSIGVSLKQSP